MTPNDALRLIESDYTFLPPELKHLAGPVPVGVDRKQRIKNAFLLAYGEQIILAQAADIMAVVRSSCERANWEMQP